MTIPTVLVSTVYFSPFCNDSYHNVLSTAIDEIYNVKSNGDNFTL